MEILQIVLLTISSITTLFFFVSTLLLWVMKKETRKALMKEIPDINNKLERLFKNESGAFEDFKKDEMAATLLFATIKSKFLSSALNATLASAITTYIYFM